ncbi:MAG: 6-pyruvoyl-tetrahydropterin synthase-related protein [Candidatus Altiarchaeota archaeon]|nr:6-pyruvoyl-tetrahydropterin synthase-related protein [Candidatus Altiarchaeota archaeon]
MSDKPAGRKDSGRKFGWDAASTVATFGILFFFMAVMMNMRPDWILSTTVTTGGDMGSHYILAQYLRDYLLPQGKLIGWYPGWLGGLPMFQYYFIPPYLLMVALSTLIPLEVAFKLVTLMWVFMLPPAAYYGLRAMGFPRPMPGVAASLTLCLLFLETVNYENYSQWGGNIKSTLAGQFPYGISFAIMALSIGLLYRGYHDRRKVALNAVVFALVALNHIYTTIIIGLVSTFFLIDGIRARKYGGVLYLAKVFILGFMLASFWYIPMALKLDWSMPPKDVFYGSPNLKWIFIPEYAVIYVLAAVGIFYAIKERDKRVFFWVYSFTIVFAFLFLCRYTNFLYVRFIPFLYLVPLILAAAGIDRLTKWIDIKHLIPPITALLIVFLLQASWGQDTAQGSKWSYKGWVQDVPAWIKWNYEGLQSKPLWPLLDKVFVQIRSANVTGRVEVEYADYNYFGTPRVFEVSPYFTNKSVMEGLLLESSLTFPFFYYLQKTVSATSWWPGFKVRMPHTPDMEHGLKVLRLYNVHYFVASSDAIRTLAGKSDGYRLEKTINGSKNDWSFSFYRINEDSDYVEYLPKEPVLVVTDDWKPFSFRWIDTDYLDVPVAYADSVGDYELEHFRIMVLNKTLRQQPHAEGLQVYTQDRFDEALKAARPADVSGCMTQTTFHEEELSASVSCTNRPLLVKVPYFPNWRAEGAEKIYLSAPSLMLVFPERKDIRIYYGTTAADMAGWAATFAGILIVVWQYAAERKRGQREGA